MCVYVLYVILCDTPFTPYIYIHVYYNLVMLAPDIPHIHVRTYNNVHMTRFPRPKSTHTHTNTHTHTLTHTQLHTHIEVVGHSYCMAIVKFKFGVCDLKQSTA